MSEHMSPAARRRAAVEAASKPQVDETQPQADQAPPADETYTGPNIHEQVIHKGARRTVTATRHVNGSHSEASFDHGVTFHPVSEMKPAPDPETE